MTSHGATSRRSLLYGHRSTPEGGSRVAWLPPRSPRPSHGGLALHMPGWEVGPHSASSGACSLYSNVKAKRNAD